MTAEAIARVVADLRAGRIRWTPGAFADIRWKKPIGSLGGPTVDATAVYRDLVGRPRPVALYEDHPCIAPPWEKSTVCYVNEHGNVIAMVTFVHPDDPKWKTAEPIDWDRVKWRLGALVFAGGRSPAIGGPFPTSGPMMLFSAAIYEDGTPADLHWEHIEERYPREHWDMAHLVLLGSLNFMNCRNVDLVEPRRPRPEARRIARTGVTVSTINVFPIGRSTRGAKRGDPVGVPLTSVRGHFSCYGPAYDRGLLFGRYEGRYWIPQHARGSAEHGETDHDYALLPETIP